MAATENIGLVTRMLAGESIAGKLTSDGICSALFRPKWKA